MGIKIDTAATLKKIVTNAIIHQKQNAPSKPLYGACQRKD
jgi:hypothetical protein